MSEPPPPGAAEVAVGNPAQALTGEAIDTILAEFRSWLGSLPAGAPLPPAPEEDEPDLHTLLGQFIALRHEVNLQTKATRGQQEQTAEALSMMREALGSLDQSVTAARETKQSSTDEQLRPLLKTLVDLYDALALASREVQRMQDGLVPLLEQMAAPVEELAAKTTPEPSLLPAAPSWWRRLFGTHRTVATALSEEIALLRNEVREERRLRVEQASRAA